LEIGATDLRQVSLKLSRLGRAFSGFRLAQLSDLHLGYRITPEHLREAINLVLTQAPDIAVITGDLVMGYRSSSAHTALDGLEAILRELAQNFPVFVVMGNHDHWAAVDEVRNVLGRAGVRELRNDVFTLQRGDDLLHLAGVDDPRSGKARLDDVLARLPQAGCAILLAHTPDFADVSARTGRFDLQLSGHSHGGQLVLPVLGPLVLPRLGQKYPAGLYRVKNMYQYTNRGLGMTRPYVRFNCPPEVTIFTLEACNFLARLA
jgi:predicted MPP superfamily phosphohydrolase